jgi:hypothetical protein
MSSSPSQTPDEEPGLLKILASVFSGILFGWLLSKFDAPNQEVGESTPQQDAPTPETQRGMSASSPLIIHAPANAPETENGERDTPFWEKATVLITLGLLVVNIFLWCATNKAANAAKDSVKLAEKNARIDERAWVAVSNISSEFRQNEDWTVRLIFKNTGKTPARNFVIWGAGESVTKGQKPTTEETKLPGRGVIAPDGSFHSNLNISGRYDWKAVDLIIHGRIEYDSVFTGGHWTRFCYYFVPDKAGRTGDFAPCDSGNDIDNGPP